MRPVDTIEIPDEREPDDRIPDAIVDRCPYCGTGPCRGSALTANGSDVERFHRLHPRNRSHNQRRTNP
jgi:hypothetical protein